MPPASGSDSTEPTPNPSGPDRDRLRRQQIIGMLLVVAAILVFTLIRANWHNIFPHGWWRW